MKKFRGHIQLEFRYTEHLGGRSDTAAVSLRLTTHDSYEFINGAKWVEDNFGYAVEEGIRDGLLECDYDPNLGIQIVLRSIESNYVNSSENSFYAAAKSAIVAQNVIANSRNRN